jgi:FMN reductase [NAD(P)H]
VNIPSDSKTHDADDHHGPARASGGGEGTIRLLHERASLRDFTDEPITEETMGRLLTAGTHSATGGNLQPYSIIVIRDAERRRKMSEWCEQSFMAKAPVHLLFCLDLRRLERWAELEGAPFTARASLQHFWIGFQDTIICAQSICTAADAIGMGSVYIGTVIDFVGPTRELFSLPRGVMPVVLLCLGYPRVVPKPRKKLEQAVVAHEEVYRDLPDDELLAAFEAKYEGVRVEATEERLKTLGDVCRETGGEALAARALETVRRRGHINAAQRLFGLHYRADQAEREKKPLLEAIEEAGFRWFR